MNPLETYQLIFENTPHCVKVVSADGRLLNINKAGLAMIGATEINQVFGATVNDFVFADDLQKFWDAHHKAMAGERVAIEFRVNTLDGNVRYMKSVMNPAGVYWENETCVLSFTQDITDELNARKEIEFKAFLLNAVQQAVIATDLNGIIVYINSYAEQLYGYTAQEMIGQHLRILMVDDPILEKRAKDLMARLVQGETWQGEFVMKTKSGRIVSVHSSNAPIIQNGVLSGIIGISFDISERKRSEQERENLIAELTQRNQDLKQFGYIASHNMRAPVTNLTGLFSLLDKDKITDFESREIITGLERSTQNLNRVLTDLIQILNIREHTSNEREYLLLNEYTNSTLQNMAALILSSKAKINTDYSKVEGVYYKKSYLQNLLFNLISNSIRFKHPEKDPIIYIKSCREGGKTKLIYTDNGLGFDMNLVKDRVFGMHQRFHKHPESKGLGLYLTKSQLRSMGGDIALESSPLKGSTFTITF